MIQYKNKMKNLFTVNEINHLINDKEREIVDKKMDFKSYLENFGESSKPSSIPGESGDSDLPEEFDWRNVYPQCFSTPQNQGTCGSSYAFAASFSLESRMCIKGEGNYKFRLSQQYIISCDDKNSKCLGDNLQNTWSFLENYGTSTYDCKPYVSGDSSVPDCTETCSNKIEPFIKYRAIKGSFWMSNYSEHIKENIHNYGPISTIMEVYEDLYLFRSKEVYQHKIGKENNYQAFTITGWGVDKKNNNREYWNLRNSWGTEWGNEGYFKVYFNDLDVNQYSCASLPMV